MPGARCTRSLVCIGRKHTSRHHRSTGTPGIPARNGFNGFLRALPGDEFVLSPSLADMACLSPVGPTHLRQLSISNGCQDHAALPSASTSVVCAPFDRSRVWLNPKPALQFTCTPDAAASTASRPASMTMANAPLWGGTARDIDLIWVCGEAEYFCRRGWTRSPTNGLTG